MPSIFLGVDREDIPYIEALSPQHVFLCERKDAETWSRIISSRSDLDGVNVQKIDANSAIVFEERLFPLPIRPWMIPKLIPEGKRRKASLQWLEAKTRSVSSVILGGGREERSLFDSVVRQLGSEIYDIFYSPLIQKRFGIEGNNLSSLLARALFFHGEDRKSFVYHSPQVPQDLAIVWNSSIEKLLVRDGRVVSVVVNGVVYDVDELLYLALPIGQILSLLEHVPKTIHVDARYISYRDESWVSVHGDTSGLSTETFFIDSAHPVVVGHTLSSHQAVFSFDASQSRDSLLLWLKDKNFTVEKEGTVSSWNPIWKIQSHFRYRRIATYLASLGIRLIGKRALFSHKSTQELLSLHREHPDLEITEFLRIGNIC